eukprot:361655-Chlamydomonas_euryale.AAC.2
MCDHDGHLGAGEVCQIRLSTRAAGAMPESVFAPCSHAAVRKLQIQCVSCQAGGSASSRGEPGARHAFPAKVDVWPKGLPAQTRV